MLLLQTAWRKGLQVHRCTSQVHPHVKSVSAGQTETKILHNQFKNFDTAASKLNRVEANRILNHHKAEIVSTGKIENTNFHVKTIACGRAMSKQCENMH